MTLNHLHHNSGGDDWRLSDCSQKTHHTECDSWLRGQLEQLCGIRADSGSYRQSRGKNPARDIQKICHYGRQETRNWCVPGQDNIGYDDLRDNAVATTELHSATEPIQYCDYQSTDAGKPR